MNENVMNKSIKISNLIKWILIIILVIFIFNFFFIFVNHHDNSIPGVSCSVVVGKFTKGVHGFVTTYNSATDESDRKYISTKFTDEEYKRFKEALKKIKKDSSSRICYLIEYKS